MINNEMTLISDYQEQMKTYLLNRIKEKKLDKCVYKMQKGKKTLVDYNKATYYDLMIELGLEPYFSEFTTTTVQSSNEKTKSEVIFSVKVEIRNRKTKDFVWSAYGLGSTAESQNWNQGGGIQDSMRMGAIVQIRAVKNAINPILSKLGLDYLSMWNETSSEKVKQKDFEKVKDYEFSPIDSLPKENEIQHITKQQIAIIGKFVNNCDKKNKAIIKSEIISILRLNHNINIKDSDISMVYLQKLTKDDFELIDIKMKEMGNK